MASPVSVPCALVACAKEDERNLLMQALQARGCRCTTVADIAEARGELTQRAFDLIVVSTPLQDSFGEQFAFGCARNEVASILLIVEAAYFHTFSEKAASLGVLTLERPLTQALLEQSLAMALATNLRLGELVAENRKLQRKLEEVKLVERAKWTLVTNLEMTEQQAHRYIEKQAMDLRTSKEEIARSVLKTYME